MCKIKSIVTHPSSLLDPKVYFFSLTNLNGIQSSITFSFHQNFKQLINFSQYQSSFVEYFDFIISL